MTRTVLTGLAASVVAALALVGCSSSHHAAGVSSPPGGSGSASSAPSAGSPGASASSPAGSSGAAGASGGSGNGSAGASGGAGATLPQASIEVNAAKNGIAVRLHKGGVLQVSLPPSAQGAGQNTTYAVSPAGSQALLAIGGAPGFFTGGADGTAKVTVTQKPVCQPGAVCADHVLMVGTVTITVWG